MYLFDLWFIRVTLIDIIDLILVTVLILGSILGVQIGQKLGERVDSSQFKTILAVPKNLMKIRKD